MADPVYPLTVVRFKVDLGGGPTAFSEVSGLGVETDVAEYRSGTDATLTVRKVPTLMKYSNVTLKRGVIAKDNAFWDWWTKNQQGQHEAKDVNITLLNEKGEDTVTWKITRAWPVKIEAPGLNASGNEVAIESLELCHEGVEIKNG